MSIDKKTYEDEGLKIDKERVLTYSGIVCPLDCKYCFAMDINYPRINDAKTYLSSRQFDLLSLIPEDVSLIMLGCDTEFFYNIENAIETLEKLLKYKKDISVITKLSLTEKLIARLSDIDNEIRNNGNILSLSISIPCLNEAKKWEPKAPSPKKRIETLKIANRYQLKTMVAIRPMLPDLSTEEMAEIIDKTKDYCYGYYSGPLYLKELDSELIGSDFENFDIEQIRPHWMPGDNIFYKIEKRGQIKSLRSLLQSVNKPLFEGAAEGIKFLKNYGKH